MRSPGSARRPKRWRRPAPSQTAPTSPGRARLEPERTAKEHRDSSDLGLELPTDAAAPAADTLNDDRAGATLRRLDLPGSSDAAVGDDDWADPASRPMDAVVMGVREDRGGPPRQ